MLVWDQTSRSFHISLNTGYGHIKQTLHNGEFSLLSHKNTFFSYTENFKYVSDKLFPQAHSENTSMATERMWPPVKFPYVSQKKHI